ncbi:MAG TPA: adenylate kinase [Armatimonadota bacterium]|nr:adenylate kinase [Armatimonadota bacterium]
MSDRDERNLVMLGPPGAGKGTQAARLGERLSVPHISTGDILREAVANGTELGRQAKGYMDAGELVPDELVIAIARERIAREDCAPGFVLDGFPRTVPQAEALGATMRELGRKPLRVINLQVSEDEIIRRLSTRRTCRGCGGIYSVDDGDTGDPCPNPDCEGELYQRSDDQPEAIAERLRAYANQTQPLIDYYGERGLLVNVPGEGAPDQIAEAVFRAARA